MSVFIMLFKNMCANFVGKRGNKSKASFFKVFVIYSPKDFVSKLKSLTNVFSLLLLHLFVVFVKVLENSSTMCLTNPFRDFVSSSRGPAKISIIFYCYSDDQTKNRYRLFQLWTSLFRLSNIVIHGDRVDMKCLLESFTRSFIEASVSSWTTVNYEIIIRFLNSRVKRSISVILNSC